MNIRFMKSTERKAVQEVLKKAFSHGDYDLNGSIWLVAEVDKKIVGACSLTIQQRMTYLSDLGTLPAYRQQGIATKLVERSLTVAKENTKEMWVICTNPYSLKIIKRLGFKQENPVAPTFIKKL